MAKHAFLSASASHRWLECPPSAKLCSEQEDRASPYAQQGTDCHELCAYLVEKELGKDVNADRQPILDRSEVYSGVYGRASINFYAFNSNGNKGIACGLNNLQKIKDGEPLGGKSRAEDDFDTEEEDDFLS